MLDINPATLRNWVEREEVDTGVRPGVTTEASDELKDWTCRAWAGVR